MKQILEDYLSSIAEWDKKHRIVGKSEPATLVEESFIALREFQVSNAQKTLVDVGAGAGILGVPWLLLDDVHRAVFIEPDQKKTAFLRAWLPKNLPLLKRSLVLTLKLQDVSRETIDKFAQGEQAAFVARAFSGASSLEDCIKKSSLNEQDFYIFQPDPLSTPSFVLKKLYI